jgi:hypothetical protein
MLEAAVLTTLWLLEAFELDVRRVGEFDLIGGGSNSRSSSSQRS